MDRERKLRAVRKVLGRESFHKGDEVIFFCRKKECESNVKAKLSVNMTTDRFHCWTCDFGGENLIPLMEKGSPEREEYLRHIEERGGRPRKVVDERKYDTPVLPNEFKTLSMSSRSPYYGATMAYLLGRGVTTDDILLWKLGYCEDGEYKHRVIIPSFDESGDLNFFVGRAIYPSMPSYKHGNFNKDFISNDYMIDWSRPVIITEGAFDAMVAGENAIPLNGSILTEDMQLFRKIVTSGVDAYFALDTDAMRKQIRIVQRFLGYGVNSFVIDLHGKKDVGSMTRDEFAMAKSQARRIRTDLDLLRLRISA